MVKTLWMLWELCGNRPIGCATSPTWGPVRLPGAIRYARWRCLTHRFDWNLWDRQAICGPGGRKKQRIVLKDRRRIFAWWRFKDAILAIQILSSPVIPPDNGYRSLRPMPVLPGRGGSPDCFPGSELFFCKSVFQVIDKMCKGSVCLN